LQKSVSRCGKDASSGETVGEGIVADGCPRHKVDELVGLRPCPQAKRRRSGLMPRPLSLQCRHRGIRVICAAIYRRWLPLYASYRARAHSRRGSSLPPPFAYRRRRAGIHDGRAPGNSWYASYSCALDVDRRFWILACRWFCASVLVVMSETVLAGTDGVGASKHRHALFRTHHKRSRACPESSELLPFSVQPPRSGQGQVILLC
jgi:hypothetical protein